MRQARPANAEAFETANIFEEFAIVCLLSLCVRVLSDSRAVAFFVFGLVVVRVECRQLRMAGLSGGQDKVTYIRELHNRHLNRTLTLKMELIDSWANQVLIWCEPALHQSHDPWPRLRAGKLGTKKADPGNGSIYLNILLDAKTGSEL